MHINHFYTPPSQLPTSSVSIQSQGLAAATDSASSLEQCDSRTRVAQRNGEISKADKNPICLSKKGRNGQPISPPKPHRKIPPTLPKLIPPSWTCDHGEPVVSFTPKTRSVALYMTGARPAKPCPLSGVSTVSTSKRSRPSSGGLGKSLH